MAANPSIEFDFTKNVETHGGLTKVGHPITRWTCLRSGLVAKATYPKYLGAMSYNSYVYPPPVLVNDGVRVTGGGISVENVTTNNLFSLSVSGGGGTPIGSFEIWFKILRLSTYIDLVYWDWSGLSDNYFRITPTAIGWYLYTTQYVSLAQTFNINQWYHFYFATQNTLNPGLRSMLVNGTNKYAAGQWGGVGGETVGANSTITFGRCDSDAAIVLSGMKFYYNLQRYTWNTTFTPAPRTTDAVKNIRVFSTAKEGYDPYYTPFLKGGRLG